MGLLYMILIPMIDWHRSAWNGSPCNTLESRLAFCREARGRCRGEVIICSPELLHVAGCAKASTPRMLLDGIALCNYTSIMNLDTRIRWRRATRVKGEGRRGFVIHACTHTGVAQRRPKYTIKGPKALAWTDCCVLAYTIIYREQPVKPTMMFCFKGIGRPW